MQHRSYLIVKRIIDLIGGIAVFLLIWPLILVITILIRLDSPGPVLFKQKRIGKDKKEFYIFKFRTMQVNTPKDTPTHLLENASVYITRMGRLLRKTSMDELPQILNILKGEMSFVGPRPALWNQYDLIQERDKYGANALVPGLTGLAQINGRDELLIPIKASFDGEYLSKVSLLFDVKIVFKTIIGVIKAKGIKEGKQEDIYHMRQT